MSPGVPLPTKVRTMTRGIDVLEGDARRVQGAAGLDLRVRLPHDELRAVRRMLQSQVLPARLADLGDQRPHRLLLGLARLVTGRGARIVPVVPDLDVELAPRPLVDFQLLVTLLEPERGRRDGGSGGHVGVFLCVSMRVHGSSKPIYYTEPDSRDATQASRRGPCQSTSCVRPATGGIPYRARTIGKRVRCKTCGHVQHVVDAGRAVTPAERLWARTRARFAASPTAASGRTASGKPRCRMTGWAGIRKLGILQESQVQGIACGLLALSATDLFMTFALLRTSPAFFESNPVAQWFFGAGT